MAKRVFNFGAGPAMLPLPVLQRMQEEWQDWQGLGVGVIEISHRSPQFEALVDETNALLRELMAIPEDYQILYCHGGGQMAFSMVPLNLLALKPARLGLYVETGTFARRAAAECGRYGSTRTIASSAPTGYDHIPELDPATLDSAASYLHITTNNTAMGTRWQRFPTGLPMPLVGDFTSELLSRTVNVQDFGLIYAGAQKNLAPPGLSVAILRKDLMGHALGIAPKLLNYAELAPHNSLLNTVNTFSIYVMNLVLHWTKEMGGTAGMERQNEAKAAALYTVLDGSSLYRAHAQPAHRSTMNVTFQLPSAELLGTFVAESRAQGLYALSGHPEMGGVRASIYNAMPLEGAQALAQFMTEFERTHG